MYLKAFPLFKIYLLTTNGWTKPKYLKNTFSVGNIDHNVLNKGPIWILFHIPKTWTYLFLWNKHFSKQLSMNLDPEKCLFLVWKFSHFRRLPNERKEWRHLPRVPHAVTHSSVCLSVSLPICLFIINLSVCPNLFLPIVHHFSTFVKLNMIQT